MKDSGREYSSLGAKLAFAAVLLTAACGRSQKTADIAQDSLLVKDMDLAGRATDTTTPAATLVRDRGSVADAPSLTTGARVRRSPQLQPPESPTFEGRAGLPKMPPPTQVNPTPVLPGRESTSTPRAPLSGGQLSPQPTLPPAPVTQPASPRPARVIQPSPVPRKDSAPDTLPARIPVS